MGSTRGCGIQSQPGACSRAPWLAGPLWRHPHSTLWLAHLLLYGQHTRVRHPITARRLLSCSLIGWSPVTSASLTVHTFTKPDTVTPRTTSSENLFVYHYLNIKNWIQNLTEIYSQSCPIQANSDCNYTPRTTSSENSFFYHYLNNINLI